MVAIELMPSVLSRVSRCAPLYGDAFGRRVAGGETIPVASAFGLCSVHLLGVFGENTPREGGF